MGEHNCIANALRVTDDARKEGCSICIVDSTSFNTQQCSATRCANCSFTVESTPKVHLCHIDKQKDGSCAMPPGSSSRKHAQIGSPSSLFGTPSAKSPGSLGGRTPPSFHLGCADGTGYAKA